MANYLLKLPVSDGRAFSFSATLSGVRYKFTFYPNTRTNGWYFHVFTTGNRMIAAGINAVANYSLLSLVTDPEKPQGYLILLDTSGKGQDPGPNDIGGRVLLIYNDGL